MQARGTLAVAALVATSVAVLSAQTGPITVTIDPAVRHQPILGWGATLSFLHNINYVADVTRDQIVADAVEDLGLTFLRVRDGVLSEPLNDDDDPHHINWAGFRDTAAIDREVRQGLAHFVVVARNAGIEPTLMLAIDLPDPLPSWMTPDEIAEHITANLLYYRDAHGISFALTSIDNEPAVDAASLTLHRAIIAALGPRLQAAGLSTRVLLNEGRDAQTAHTGIAALIDDAAVRPHVGLLTWHLYGTNDPFRSLIRDVGGARDIRTGMTEFIGAGVSDLAADLAEGGVSFWSGGLLLDRGGLERGRGLFSVEADGASYTRGPAYQALRQVMRLVRPNAVRVGASSPDPGLRVLAFDQAGGPVVVIVNGTGRRVGVRVVGLPPPPPFSPIRFWFSAIFAGIYSQGATSNDPVFALDPNDIITVYPRRNSFAEPTYPVHWTASPAFLTQPDSVVGLSAAAVAFPSSSEFDTMTYDWRLLSAPAGAPVVVNHPRNQCCNMSSLPDATASGLTVPGTYVFTVTSHQRSWAGGGSLSAPSSRDVTVRVYPGNQPPVIAEGHRFFKEEWLILPQSSQTYGPDFISAFDLEGDPVTTTFSVLRQPAGANAQFSGTTVTGLTVAGEYAFRFTASDGARTSTRDFVRLVVGGVPVKGVVIPGTERRPRQANSGGSSSSGPTQAKANAPISADVPTLPARPAQLTSDGAALLDELLNYLLDRGLIDDGWQLVELRDTDGDGTLDLARIRLRHDLVWTVVLDGRS